MENCAIYVRVSTQTQHTDRQRTELKSLALSKNYNIVDTYEDIMSGFKNEEDRKELNRLKEDAKKGAFSIILISELSRLARKTSLLIDLIEYFKGNQIKVYFQKQNIWVNEKNNLGGDILLHVLNVFGQYEAELLAERTLSGKIEKVKNKKGHIGGLTPFGYKSINKQLVIDEDEEAPIVREAFELYAKGWSQHEICDSFNLKKYPSPYNKKLKESQLRRELNGLNKKVYTHHIPDTLVWIQSSLNRILKNRLYIGERNLTIYKPDPSNVLPIAKRQNREILSEIKEKIKDFQIVDIDLFEEVQRRIVKNRTNKDLSKKHSTLLKGLITCGCCGGNYTGAGGNKEQKYVCFRSIRDAKTRKIECKESLEVRRYKLDGLVWQLTKVCIVMDKNFTNSNIKIEQYNEELTRNDEIKIIKETKLENSKAEFFRYILKASKYDIPDTEIEVVKQQYDIEIKQLNNELFELNSSILLIKSKIKSIEKLKNDRSLLRQCNDIEQNPALLKSIMFDAIEKIVITTIMYKHSLVQIHLISGDEFWGIIKSTKPKNSDYYIDQLSGQCIGLKFPFWINNKKDCNFNFENKYFKYNGGNENLKGVESGDYSAQEWINILEKNDMVNVFTYYYYYSHVLNNQNITFQSKAEITNSVANDNLYTIGLNNLLTDKLPRK
jgi:DNA invertase Pin-like site-specific DNA recombinase